MSKNRQKRLVSINLGNFGSTGSIMEGVCSIAEENGMVTYKAYPYNAQNRPKKQRDIIIVHKIYLRICKKLAYMTGYNGCFAILPTVVFLMRLSLIRPDVIHLHNLHNSYINLPLLFCYIKKHKIKTVWTLHDCWAFTGHCPHFTMIRCYRWREECGDCPQLNIYPAIKKDKTAQLLKMKKKWFQGISDLTIVTPSLWLSKLVKQSFLAQYPLEVINNGIDLSVFKPFRGDLRKKYGISKDVIIILGVAFDWGVRKGLDVFIDLASVLGKEYQIVLVGTDENVDSKIPDNIICIRKTSNQKELASIYTEADVFINPTREDNFPTVNIEALACGTPVVTYNTGGSPEMINQMVGTVVACDDFEALVAAIKKQSKNKHVEECINAAAAYSQERMFLRYLDLFGL